jgi:hypothetical protein
MHVGERHFGGRHQVEIPFAGNLEQIRLELWKIPGPGERRRVRHERWLDFGISVLLRMQIEHEVDECTRETGTRTQQHRKPCTGDLRATFEIDDAKSGPEIPMRLRCKRERARRADATNLCIVVSALPHGDTRMRNVGDDEQSLIASLLEQIEFHPKLLDLCGALTIRLLNLARILSLPLRSRDLVGRGVLFASQSFQLREQPSATSLERGKLLELARHIDAAIGKCGSDGFEIVSEKGGIDHVRTRVHIV